MRLGDSKFFNLLALIATRSNPGASLASWRIGAVTWTREVSSHKGPAYFFRIETDVLQHSGRRGWTLLVGREIWWQAGAADAFRSGNWAHLSKGARGDVLKWLAEQETALGL